MYALGDKLNLAYGDQTNLKITTKEDIELFELYVLGKKQKESAIRETMERDNKK